MLADFIKKNKITQVRIRYKKEFIKFNLYDELQINENIISQELTEQPSYYGFLTLLHKKLTRIMEDLEMEKDKTYSRLYLSKKDEVNKSTSRPYPDDSCKAYALQHEEYISVYKKYTSAKEDAGIIGGCVKSFEQRKDILQTLSANNRKEI